MSVMLVGSCTWLPFACLLCVCVYERLTLDNGIVRAGIDTASGLVSLQGRSSQGLAVGSDTWEVRLARGRTLSPGRGCELSGHGSGVPHLVLNFTCGDLLVEVAYALRPAAAHIEKRLGITSRAPLGFVAADVFKGTALSLEGSTAEPQWYVQNNPLGRGLQVAAFARFSGAVPGAFVSMANPWGRHQKDRGGLMTVGYEGSYTHDPAKNGLWFRTEPAVLGLTTQTPYMNEGLTAGERMAFMRCVENYHLDSSMRRNRTVKLNVAWDENDYQIDVATIAGQTEYKRIIDRSADFGLTHVVYEPRNTLHSTRFNSTDGWGWEEALWFSMGELLREGRWDPRTDRMPEDILEMVQYAESRGIKLMAYAYPCLAFEALKEYFVESPRIHGGQVLNLAPPAVQEYWIDVMTSFLVKSGAGGFAWDHDIFAGHDSSLHYSQWRAWMRILAALRERLPDIVMDHRQTNHMWGPWYQLAGSYAEPIAGDENPETFGVPSQSLHTDHVAADNMRRVNYIYSTRQLIPPSRMPGFAFHQTERTDDDGIYYCTNRQRLCVNNSNTRDFDYLGYKYSLLSSIGTAGLNNVLTMLPARDPEEFTLFPKEDIQFVRSWLAWTDAHLEELGNTQWIPTLPPPLTGGVDGTHAIANDEGFVFLFNPGMAKMTVNLTVDESIGLSNDSAGVEWEARELYPRQGHVGNWQFGEVVSVSVAGSDARVLQLSKRRGSRSLIRLKDVSTLTLGTRTISSTDGGIQLLDATAPTGSEASVTFRAGGEVVASVSGLTVNGVLCEGAAAIVPNADILAKIQFAGSPVVKAMPVSPQEVPGDFTGGWFNTSFSIPSAVLTQLHLRNRKYPVNWTYSAKDCGLPHCVDDSKATWLIPSRLLLAIVAPGLQPGDPLALRVDGNVVTLQRSFNSRGLQRDKVFLGFYFDASSLSTDVKHELALLMPKLKQGQFKGLFWENVETQYTDEVISCIVGDSSPGHEVLV